MNGGHYGVFTKDGQAGERTAETPGDAVQLTFDGWSVKTPATAKGAPSNPARTGDTAGDTGTSKTTR
jgi:hypothetical protein